MRIKTSCFLYFLWESKLVIAIVKTRYFLTNLFIQSCFLAMELSCFPFFCFYVFAEIYVGGLQEIRWKIKLIKFTSLMGANLQQTAVGTPLYFEILQEGRTGETSWIPVDSMNRDILSFKNHNWHSCKCCLHDMTQSQRCDVCFTSVQNDSWIHSNCMHSVFVLDIN